MPTEFFVALSVTGLNNLRSRKCVDRSVLMKKGIAALILTAAIGAFALTPAQAQDQPLGPGWLSLDNSVGALDKNIADGRSAIEGALGIGISGFLDTGYQWSSNHPKNPRNISGRYFDKDYNKLVFNYFHVAVEKPE